MFASLARFGALHWKLVLGGTAAFAFVAWSAFRTLPIEAYPDVTDPMVEVVTLFPQQSAERVERQVTLEIERVLAGTPGLTNLRSVSVFGLSLVTLRFDEGTVDRENRAYVAERLREARLPEGAEAMLGPEATPVGQILRYTLVGPRSLRDLRAIQDWTVARRLRAVPGVADVITFGGFERQYAVRIDPVRLTAMGTTVGDVYAALERTNSNSGGGYVGIGSQEFIVRGLGTIKDPAELGHALIRNESGVPIRVRDVADVVESSKPRRGSVGRNHDDEVVEGIVLLRRGENPSEVLRALHERIDELHAGILPKDVRIDVFYDRRTLIDHTLSTVGHNLVHGALLVVAVVLLFLRSLSAALIVGLVIPLTLLASFLGLRALGMSANLISLGAIDFGILVEPAAVFLEVTLHAWATAVAAGGALTDRTRVEGIVAAAKSVSRPIVFSTLIVVAGLVPLFLLERVEGRIFAPMAFTYVFALVAAPIAALLVVPALTRVLMRGDVPHGDGRLMEALKRGYGVVLSLARRRAIWVRASALAVFVLLGAYASRIGTEFLPELNEGGLYITAVFPSTISLDETKRHVPAIRDRVLELPEVTEVLSHVGRPEDAAQIEGPNNVELFVKLAPMSTWRKGLSRQALEAELRESLSALPGVQFNFSQPITDRVFETISGIIGQVVVKIRGEDLDAMTEIAEAIRDAIAGVDGITDLSLYQAGDVPQMKIELDRERLAMRGIHVDDVQRTLEIALGGSVATEVWEGERRYGVALRLPESVRRDAEALGRLVVGDAVRRVTLAEVAEIHTGERGRSAIWRENLSRFVAVKFNVRGRDLGSAVEEARAAVDALGLELPDGITLSWGGELENQRRAMSRLESVVPLTLLAIVLLLFANFRRWRPALTIVALLPLSVVAAVAFLRLTGETFSVSSAIGCITLVGQTSLLGVLMCSRIDERAAAGDDDPALTGAMLALRPILLTVCLAAFGLLPAALSYDMGSESQRPFARALIGGLFTSLPLVLVLLPILYAPGAKAEVGRTRRVVSLAAALLAVFSFASPARASEGEVIVTSEAQLLERWLTHGVEVKAIRAEIDAARFERIRARVLPNPELGVTGVFLVAGEPPDGRRNVGAEVAWELPIMGEVRARKDAAERAVDVAEMQIAHALWVRAAEIRRALVELVHAAEAVRLLERFLDELVALEATVAARVGRGVDPAYDELRLSLELDRMRADLAGARLRRDGAEAAVRVLVNDPSIGVIDVRFDGLSRYEGTASEGALVREALAARPDVWLERHLAKEKRSLAHQYLVEARPNPVLTLGTYVAREADGANVIGGLRLPLPVADRNRGLVGRTRAEAAVHEMRAEALEARVRTEVGAALARLAAARETLARHREGALPRATSLVEKATRAYAGGVFSIVDLLDAARAHAEALEKELDLAREVAEAEAELARVLAAAVVAGRAG